MVFTDRDLVTGVDEEKVTKRRMHGTQDSSEKGCFIHGSMCLYIVIQGSFRQKIKLSKNPETRYITTVTKGITVIIVP